jgi:hypothetical protein
MEQKINYFNGINWDAVIKSEARGIDDDLRDVQTIDPNFHPSERYGWWINELESLGVGVKKTNEFNDLKEIRSLAESIKQVFIKTTRPFAN